MDRRGSCRHIGQCSVRDAGTGEAPVAPVFVDGRKTVTLRGERIADEFVEILENYVAERYAARGG